jgi:uncharacterized repeat protein (TIGR03803 family)
MNHIPRYLRSILEIAIFGVLTLLVFSVLVMIAARPVHAQTLTWLYDFQGSPDGAYPQSSLTFYGGNYVYGTTQVGGTNNRGTVYQLETFPQHTETVLYSFCSAFPSCSDGATPKYSSVIFDQAGNLYGTTNMGGANQGGVVFEVSPAGDSWAETVLYSFCSLSGCADGIDPVNGLIFDSAGNLYGTTQAGGANGAGVVFELSPSGSGWTEQVIYEPGSYAAGLTMDTAGNILGVNDRGTVFELLPNGDGGWTPTVIYDFGGDYKLSGTPALDQAGNIYCTMTGDSGSGTGTLWKLSLVDGKWTKKSLELWKRGLAPLAGVVLDGTGNIYGTTQAGGTYGGGTIFELSPNVKGDYDKIVLWNFLGANGVYPYASMTLDGGNLYGTVTNGGRGGVFELTP